MSSRARQAEDMLQSIVSCQRQRDETRREVLARRAIFVSSLSRSPAAMFQAGRPCQRSVCTTHPGTSQNRARPRKIIVGEELVRLIW